MSFALPNPRGAATKVPKALDRRWPLIQSLVSTPRPKPRPIDTVGTGFSVSIGSEGGKRWTGCFWERLAIGRVTLFKLNGRSVNDEIGIGLEIDWFVVIVDNDFWKWFEISSSASSKSLPKSVGPSGTAEMLSGRLERMAWLPLPTLEQIANLKSSASLSSSSETQKSGSSRKERSNGQWHAVRCLGKMNIWSKVRWW